MSWFAVSRGRLEYRGRIDRDAFGKWCATKDGRAAIARVASGIGFSIFGRAHGAKRRLWRELVSVSRTEAFAAAIAVEAGHYLQVLAEWCYADSLPRTMVALRRVVLVPRAMIAGRVEAGTSARLSRAPAIAALDEAVRAFVIRQVVVEMDAAVRKASPDPGNPVIASDGWACIGVRVGTVWMDALWAGPDGTGHVFMYELPRQALSRRDRKALQSAMEQMNGDVAALSRTARDAVLRSAAVRRT